MPKPPKLQQEDARLWRRVRQSATELNSERFHVALEQHDQGGTSGQTLRGTNTASSAEALRALKPLHDQLNGTRGRPARTSAGSGPALDHIKAPRKAQPWTFKAHGDSAGLDRATSERIRRGKMSVDGRLDLHGMTQDRAHGVLMRFLTDHHRRGSRLVLVVTGKGNSATGGGILKRQVPQWLNLSPLREIVLTYNHARPDQGGSGALTVLLKRKRT